MKILFMGTPDFAAGSLKSLIEAGYEITAVVTQPDRPKGRSGQPVFSPVKEVAVANGIPVLQPVRIKNPEETAKLQIVPGKDLCTLMTCTPYGINTHRLLVRGHRLEEGKGASVGVTADALQIDPMMVAPVIAIPMVIVLFIIVITYKRKRKI